MSQARWKTAPKGSLKHADALVDAVRAGSLTQLTALLTGASLEDINRPGTLGATALHTAVWTNDVEMIIQLLGSGASPDVKDTESGWTALHRAVYFGHLVAATTLLEYGASLTEEDHAGRVPADLLPSTAAAHQPLAPSEAATEVYAMGDGVNYTLGTGAVGLQLMPHALDTLHTRRITCIATSKFHSAAVALDGTLFTWGFGRGGRLGHPEEKYHSGQEAVIHPRAVEALQGHTVRTVAAAKHHTLAVTADGSLFAWGRNRDGQLGTGNGGAGANGHPTPRLVTALKPFACVAAAAAHCHSVAVTSAGALYAWGGNRHGQLGFFTPDGAACATPRKLENLQGRRVATAAAAKRHTAAVTVDGNVYTWGYGQATPRKVSLGTAAAAMAGATGTLPALNMHHTERLHATQVACGYTCTTVITRCGATLCWTSGQALAPCMPVVGLLGRHAVAASAGKTRTAVATAEGDMYTWETTRVMYKEAGTPCSPNDRLGCSPHTAISPSPRERVLASSQTAAGAWPASPPSSRSVGQLATLYPSRALTVQRTAGLKRVVGVAAGEKHSLALVRAAMPEEPAQSAQLERSSVHGSESGRAERGEHAESGAESSDEEGADDEWMLMAGMDMDDDATIMRDDGFAQVDRIRAAVTRQVQPKPSPTSKGRRCARGGGGVVPRLSTLAEAAACRGLNLRSVGYLLAAACSLGAHNLKASSMQMLMGNLGALLGMGGADLLLDMPEDILENLEAHRATQGPCRASRCLSTTHRRAAAEEQGADARREQTERPQQPAVSPQHAQRTLRTLRKKLREAEGLAARAEAGELLDTHQQEKLARCGLLQEQIREAELHIAACQLDEPCRLPAPASAAAELPRSTGAAATAASTSASRPPEDAPATADACGSKLSADGNGSGDDDAGAKEATTSSSILPRAGVSVAGPIPISERAASGVVEETEDEKVRRLQPRPSPKSRKTSMRKGNLSMFLHGELERAAPHEPHKAAEPARTWGAVAPSSRVAPSLACIQNEQVRSGTSPTAAGQWAKVGDVGATGGTSRVPGSSPSAAINVTMPQRRDSGGGMVNSWGAVGAAGAAAAVRNEGSSVPEGSFTVSLAHLVKRPKGKGQKEQQQQQQQQPLPWGAAAATPFRVTDCLMSIQQEQSLQRAQASLSKSVGALDGSTRGGHLSGVMEPTESRWYRPTPVAATSLHDIQMEEARAMRELLERKAQEERVAAEALLAKAKEANAARQRKQKQKKKAAGATTTPAQQATAAAATPAQQATAAAATPAQKAAPTPTPPRKKSSHGKTARDRKRDKRPVLTATTSEL